MPALLKGKNKNTQNNPKSLQALMILAKLPKKEKELRKVVCKIFFIQVD